MSTINPQILPGRPVSKEEHRRSLTATVVIAVIVVIIGIIFWAQLPREKVGEGKVSSGSTSDRTVLTPEQSQIKVAQISTTNKRVVLTPAQKKLKAQQLKEFSASTSTVSSK